MDFQVERSLSPRQLLRSFLGGIRDYSLISLDPDGRIDGWPANAADLFGYASPDIIGQHFSTLFPEELWHDGQPLLELQTAQSDGHFEAVETQARKDGSCFWAHVITVPMVATAGRRQGFGRMVRDISDKVAAGDTLRMSEAHMRGLISTILDVVVDGVVTINRRGEIQFFNQSAQRMFGYTPEEVIGRNVSMLMPDPFRSEHDQYLRNYHDTRDAKIIGIGREVKGQRKDGTVFPVELAVGEVPLGETHAFVGTLRDSTERHEAEQAREQLRQAQKMEAIGQLTGGIAHDFNNLLSVIVGHLDLLHDITEGEEQLRRHLAPCLTAALRGSELTQRLLAFGRRQTLQPRLVNVNTLISAFVNLLHRTLGERIEIITALSPSLWETHVDAGQLENAILNLAVNARDAMPAGGKLIIETANVTLDDSYTVANAEVMSGDYVMIAVSDTGCGMSSEVTNRVFEPFFTTKAVGRGSGLGLSMVYGFVKQSEGHIKLYSEVGRGTSIKIYLPRTTSARKPGPEAGDTTKEALAAPRAARLVLVVEDDQDVLKLTAAMVESLGYDVITAETGDTALPLIEAHHDIALLLTDVMLPGSLHGPSLAERAQALRPGLPVLFVSGYAENAIIESGVLAPGVNLLSKPFRKSDLQRMLKAIML